MSKLPATTASGVTTERIAGIYPDGSMNVFPANTTVDRAKQQCWDKNETDPAEQARIVSVRITPGAILYDAVAEAKLLKKTGRCPHCNKELAQ